MSQHEHLQPEGVHDSHAWGYSHVVSTRPGRLVFVSGQVAVDPAGKSIGEGDLAAQTDLALSNLRASLAAAGAGPQDVAMMRIYVVALDGEKLGVVAPRVAAFFSGSPPSAQTLLGVQALAFPSLRVEIEACAVVPDPS
jgi:enamine deaminase RidA (YjgF/YER057c/UK114 family)